MSCSMRALDRNRPFGINSAWFATASSTQDEDPSSKHEDRLFSLKQRHTYFQQPGADPSGPQAPPEPGDPKARRTLANAKGAKDQSVRMRRLRPRQVLCSQCRSICNENSENVQQRATAATAQTQATPTKAGATLSTPAVTLVTPVSTLPTPAPTSRVTGVLTRSSAPPPTLPAVKTEVTPPCVVKTEVTLPPPPPPSPPPATGGTEEYRASTVVQGKMILRKRKLDEEPPDPPSEPDTSPVTSPDVRSSATTPPVPVLRISFANAEGTVVKIAAAAVEAGAKAARKALKKAKKEAQRRKVPFTSPEDSPTSLHRHRKHHKRKRKRRDENEAGDEDDDLPVQAGWGCSKGPFTESDLRPTDGLYEEVRNNCLRQKLSISLKRLSSQAYARLSPKHGSHHHHRHHQEDEDEEGSDTDGRVPDFPRHEPLQPHPQAQAAPPAQSGGCVRPLMMRITSQSVPRCVLEGGREMAVGDVVWGKIHGFPWWPGKVLSLTVSRREGGGVIGGVPVAQQAHVAWFGSSTSSLMPCHQLAPFLRYFKARYNRKKRGPYKEAIRQAQIEAQRLQPPLPLPPVPATAPVEELGLQPVT